MPRETEYYRDNLSRVMEAFPEKEILTLTDISKWWGVSSAIVTRSLGLHKGEYISKATLARKMAVLHNVSQQPLNRRKY
jgi:hypothetical protein